VGEGSMTSTGVCHLGGDVEQNRSGRRIHGAVRAERFAQIDRGSGSLWRSLQINHVNGAAVRPGPADAGSFRRFGT